MRSVALVGCMGAGKSSVGRRLASRMRIPFVDTDDEIEKRAGMRVAELIHKHGLPRFRAWEREVLADLAGELKGSPVVCATGGGIVVTPECRDMLKASFSTIWLRAQAETLAVRLQGEEAAGRPLLAGATEADGLTARLRQLLDEREPWYQEVAHWTVNVDDLALEAVVDQIILGLDSLD
jgi:shikimate kinase